jgi:hypothetical protein
VDELNLHEDNANPTRLPLPLSEQMRETLQRLEERATGVTKLPPNEAYAAIHEVEDLIQRYRTFYAQNPLPNQKVRKPRTVKQRPKQIAAPRSRVPFRSVRDRAFATA